MSMVRHTYTRRQTRNAFRASSAPANNSTALAKKTAKFVLSSAAGVAAINTLTKYSKKKKKSLVQRAKSESGGHGGSYSNFFYTPRKIPRAFSKNWKALGKNYQQTNGAGRQTSTVGTQSIFNLISMFNYADLNAISNLVQSNHTNKILYKSCSAEILLTNQDAGNCRIILYDVIARRDLATNSNLANPPAAWSNSYGDEGATNSNNTIPGATPFSSDLLTQYFKVVKMTHVTLAQGQCHTHRIKFNANAVLDAEVLQYNTNGYKGITCFTMMVSSGMPYNDSTTKTQVSLGTTAIDWVYCKQYEYTWMQDLDTNYSATQSLPTSFTVNEDIMNEATGTATVDTSA